jgi:integrase
MRKRRRTRKARSQNCSTAGSDPHWDGPRAAQKVVGSLPAAPSRSGPCFVRVQKSKQTICNASRTTSRKRRGGKLLPLLKAPAKQPKTTTLQVRLEEEVRHKIDRWTIQRDHLLPAGIRAGVGPIGWHSFRHSYSTLLRSLQVDLKVQQELLRHSDIRTTMNIYTQAVPDAMREANSRVVEMVLPKRKVG